jgi:hypothetical protein
MARLLILPVNLEVRLCLTVRQSTLNYLVPLFEKEGLGAMPLS